MMINNFCVLIILIVNYLMLIDFEGFFVSCNCSGKIIEGIKKFYVV